MSDVILIGQLPAADRATGVGTVAALCEAIGVVSSVCDYAETLDGQGFNAADAWLGHVLAQMPADLWSDDAALAAWDMLRKYRGQLSTAGIGYDQLLRPDGADQLEAGRREQARERARLRARQWREQQYRTTHSYVRCDGDGEPVTLAFPYDPDLVAACRTIDDRRYDGAAKANVFPFTSLPAVIDLAAGHGIEVTADVRALAAIAASQAAQAAAQPEIRLDERSRIIIDAAFDPALTEALKQASDGRSTWNRAAGVHRLPVRNATRLPAVAGQFGLRISDQGKTLSSLAAVAADSAWPAVVVCRPSLTLNWAAEIGRFFPGLSVELVSGTSPQPVPAGAGVVIIGSAALAAKPRQTEDGGKDFGWVEELAKLGPKALIIDEGQDAKERSANRSQACEQLAADVIGRDGLVLDLTGTAILNRPRELCQQLSILGRIGEFGGPKAFLWRYCLSETNEWGASYNGARNLIELHDRLRSSGIMIRRSDDAALGLPPCREHELRIPAADLDPAVMARYRDAEADLLAFLAEQARQAAQRLGKDPASAAVQAAMRAQAAGHLVAINTLRQLAGQAKRGYVTAWVREHVAAGEKVMVAAHHREEVDAYAAAFGELKLQGGQPVAEKEAVKARFQQQPAAGAPVIAVAIGAGGVGHTLTAARIGIQAEQAWTPGETQQMKKRLHRIGQDRAVDYYVTVAEGTIDEHLWAVVSAKQATLDAVLDGRSDSGAAADEKSVAAELTWRLTQEGLGSQPGDHALRAAGDLTQDEEPPPGNQSGENTSQDGAGLRILAAPRPGHDGTSSHAADAGSSERQLPAASEHGTTAAAVPAWPAADHGSLDRPVRPVSHRVLVTGSRTWTDEQVIAGALRGHWDDGNALLVTGACPGDADAIAERIWRAHGGLVERHPAAWETGRDAGMRRNAAMVALGADACLAFIRDASPGATHAAHLAGQAGIPVRRFPAGTSRAAEPGTEDPAAPSRQERAEADGAAVAARRAFGSGGSTDDDVLGFIETAARLDPSRPAAWQIMRVQFRDHQRDRAAATAARRGDHSAARSFQLGRWGTRRGSAPGPGSCQYCGTACGQRGDCPAVTCLACGTRQCGDTPGGRCIVCLDGLLHPFGTSTGEPLICGYSGCQAPAVASAPRIGRVCGGHLDRVTIRVNGTTVTVAGQIRARVAERDIGGPELAWIGPGGPAPATRHHARELQPGDRIYHGTRWLTIAARSDTGRPPQIVLTCQETPGQLELRPSQRLWVHRASPEETAGPDGSGGSAACPESPATAGESEPAGSYQAVAAEHARRERARRDIYGMLAGLARQSGSDWTELVPGDIRAGLEAANRQAAERLDNARRAYGRFLQAPESEFRAHEAERIQARDESTAATLACYHDGRHTAGKHQDAMLRWAASLMAERGMTAVRQHPHSHRDVPAARPEPSGSGRSGTPGDASRTVAALACGRPVYGMRDDITIRHWREAHVDPDKVRAWCRDTGRDEPPARGTLPRDLEAGYLAERGAAGIPMPGGPDRAGWLAQRPVLRQPFTARLGPFTVAYGPCPRCGHPTAAEPGEPLPLCVECAARPDHHHGAAAQAGGSWP